MATIKKGQNAHIENPRRRTFSTVVLPPQLEKLTNLEVMTSPTPVPKDLGPLQNLLGVWTGKDTGWNMIALPFNNAPAAPAGAKFRLLMNQYSEELQFTFIDDGVPNRGLKRPGTDVDFDQSVVTIDYQQKIVQTQAEDRPKSGLAGPPNLPIHHEPGLWLYDKNRRCLEDRIVGNKVVQVELDIARLASVPHGNSVLALGRSEKFRGMPDIPPLNGLPIGRFEDLISPEYDFKSDPYLAPYKHYINAPFMGNMMGVNGFPGFNPADMNQILRFHNKGVKILRTTMLMVDTTVKTGGISNAPFTAREAQPVSMKSTFWIQELDQKDPFGNPKMRIQYCQVVMLNFFNPREDGFSGQASWPHISICTLEKVPIDLGLMHA